MCAVCGGAVLGQPSPGPCHFGRWLRSGARGADAQARLGSRCFRPWGRRRLLAAASCPAALRRARHALAQ
eukprot:10928740-Alexandrium_andersonii.AAC.1